MESFDQKLFTVNNRLQSTKSVQVDGAGSNAARQFGAHGVIVQRVMTDQALPDARMSHPILINRPIVVTPLGVRLCRPSQVILDIPPNPAIGTFTKEEGHKGRRRGDCRHRRVEQDLKSACVGTAPCSHVQDA